MAVWSQNRYIIGGLVLVILGHWSLILQGMWTRRSKPSAQLIDRVIGVLLSASWVPDVGCVITSTSNTVLAATFIYSMCFDLLVLTLNAYKLLGVGSKNQGFGTSRIAKMIFEDGLIFFIIAYVESRSFEAGVSTQWCLQVPCQFIGDSIHALEPQSDHECHFQCSCCRRLNRESSHILF